MVPGERFAGLGLVQASAGSACATPRFDEPCVAQRYGEHATGHAKTRRELAHRQPARVVLFHEAVDVGLQHAILLAPPDVGADHGIADVLETKTEALRRVEHRLSLVVPPQQRILSVNQVDVAETI